MSGKPIDVSNRKQLFIDERFIAASENVHLTANQPVLAGCHAHGLAMSMSAQSLSAAKHGHASVAMAPTSVAIEPGVAGDCDDGSAGSGGRVFQDGGIFRCYFNCRSAEMMAGKFDAGGDAMMPLGYGESTDGVHWVKPKLGLHDWKGSKANHLTCLDWGDVMIDPHAAPEARYKLLCCAYSQIGAKNIFDALDLHKGGMYFYTSPDGLRWTWQPRRVLPLYPDSQNQVDYDERLGKYVAYIRTWPRGFFRAGMTYGRAVGRIELDDPMQPWPHQPADPEFKPWGKERIAGVSTEVPTVLAYPGYTDDGHWTDIYNPAVVRYPWAEEAYLAFPSLNHYVHDSKIPNHSTLEIGMAVSRDGIAWNWPSTEAYIPFGPAGSGRSGMLYMHVGLIRAGDEIYQYHFGTDIQHHGQVGKVYGLEGCRNSGRVYRTVQRLDGFVSADFPAGGGALTTPAMRTGGRELRLNVNAAGGALAVAIQDESGRPLRGLGIDDCYAVTANSVDSAVSWRGSTDLASITSQPIRLCFHGQATKLFAFQFR
jgi:hypothetical protein